MIDDAILLIGNAPVDLVLLAQTEQYLRAHHSSLRVVAADGGALYAQQIGVQVDDLIGDFDSGGARLPARRHWHQANQDNTDFDKALAQFSARVWCALGFSGGRLDHTMAVLASLANLCHTSALINPQKFLLLDDAQVSRVCVGAQSFAVQPEARIGVLALRSMRFSSSQGLFWPLDGLELAPDRMVSVSNRAIASQIILTPEASSQSAAYVVTAPTELWPLWWHSLSPTTEPI